MHEGQGNFAEEIELLAAGPKLATMWLWL